jgi:carbon storage regulator
LLLGIAKITTDSNYRHKQDFGIALHCCHCYHIANSILPSISFSRRASFYCCQPFFKEDRVPMLVLSRKVGERILIGENISVTVVRVTGGGVRLGVEAPSNMPVVRQELKDRMEPQRGPGPNASLKVAEG